MGLKLYCTAGVSHFLLYPNGDVYTCMAYYNSKKKPIGNVLLENFKINRDLEICELPKCYAVCDLDWTNKWLIDERGKIVKKIKASVLNNKDIQFNKEALENQEFNPQFKNTFAHIVWIPTLLCNYECIYCGCAMGVDFIRKNFRSAYPELPHEEWICIFKEKILPEFNIVVIDISGGEPFLSKSTISLLNMVTKRCLVTLTTNASTDIIRIIEENGFKPQNRKTNSGISFHLSWHPLVERDDFNSFLNKAIYLKENGFLGAVNFVAHPKQLHLIDYYREIFDKNGIPFVILYWCGKDNEGNEGYKNSEVKFIRERIKDKMQLKVPEPLIFNKPDIGFCSPVEILDSPREYFQGIPFSFKLKVNNLCIDTVIETADKDSLSIGCLMYHLTSNGKVKINEPRKKIAEDALDLNFTTDFLIDSNGLEPGSYELKFDIVDEDKFWFEDLGFKPTIIQINVLESPFKKVEISLINYTKRILNINSDNMFNVMIKNVGNLPWPINEKENDFKLGCRLINDKNEVKSEYRSKFQLPLKPKEEFMGHIEIHIPKLAKGQYVLKFDIVNENKFWLEDMGSSPFILPVTIMSKES